VSSSRTRIWWSSTHDSGWSRPTPVLQVICVPVFDIVRSQPASLHDRYWFKTRVPCNPPRCDSPLVDT
jgi:hypothetical protein